MAGLHVTSASLMEVIAQVPPAHLLGLDLLSEYAPEPGDWYPTNVPIERIVEATAQQIAYGIKCTEVADLLATLPPVPLDTPVAEFSI
jgi:hypothetical protein